MKEAKEESKPNDSKGLVQIKNNTVTVIFPIIPNNDMTDAVIATIQLRNALLNLKNIK